MGDDSPPAAPAPTIINAPAPLTQTAGEAADAQVEAFKKLIPLLPQYAQTQTDIQASQAPQLSAINLKNQQEYGPQLIQAALDNLKLADPTGLAVRKELGNKALAGLSPEEFGKLSPAEQNQAEQSLRAAQVARGGGTGSSDAIQEAISKYQLGNQKQQQQLSNAGSFLNGSTPQAQFGSLNNAGQTAQTRTQDTSGFSSNLFPSTNSLIGNQAANYNTFANFTGQNNNLMNRQFEYHDQNTSNPFLTGLSAFGSFAGQILGGSGGGAAMAAM